MPSAPVTRAVSSVTRRLVAGPPEPLPIALKTNNFRGGRRPRRAVGTARRLLSAGGRWTEGGARVHTGLEGLNPVSTDRQSRQVPPLRVRGFTSTPSGGVAARAFYERHSIRDKGAL